VLTWRLVWDIRSRAVRAGHEIAGKDIHLDLPKAQVRSTAVFGSGDVLPD
jgi:hypothetical protein